MGTAEEAWGPDEIRLVPGERVVVGRSAVAAAVLGHPSVSRRHAELRLVSGRLVVTDLGSRYGTFVDGERVKVRTVASGARVAFGAVRYVFSDGALGLAVAANGVGIEARELALERGGRRLIADIDVSILPGQFVGLIGP
jgi:pSer/pThr/pTyr-binding forkhead associated (FHA) protein